MRRSRAEELLRNRDQPQRPTLLELLFDLVFVFGFSQVSTRLAAELTSSEPTFGGAAGTLVLLLALLMVWFAMAWLTDLYDVHRPAIQSVLAVAMFGGVLMALALPRAFRGGGLVFAGAYVTIHLVRGLVLVPALRGSEVQRRAAAILLWFAVSAVPWIVGAVVHGSPRGVLWTLAIAVDYTGALLLWPAPWTLRLRPRFPVAAEYMSERYRQFFIIALGELILVAGATYSANHYGAAAGGHTPAFALSFATVLLLWRIYTFPVGQRLPTAIAAAPDPDRFMRRALVAHTLMLVAIVIVAAGSESVIEHPGSHLTLARLTVSVGGVPLFLVGQAVLRQAVVARTWLIRVIALLVLAGLVPVLRLVPLLAGAATAVVVLAGVAIADAAVQRHQPM